jgi:hypothetical protein
MLIPPLNNKLPVLGGKLLRLGQFSNLQSLRLSSLDAGLDVEYSLTTSVAHMDVNRPMLVAVEEEPVTVLLENLRHAPNLRSAAGRERAFSPNDRTKRYVRPAVLEFSRDMARPHSLE